MGRVWNDKESDDGGAEGFLEKVDASMCGLYFVRVLPRPISIEWTTILPTSMK